jgi:hypothetical protein
MSALLRRRRVLGGFTALAVLAAAGAAIAYFTSTGTGTGTASVGFASNWGVQVNSPAATFSLSPNNAIYPGNGTETIPFVVTNNGSGDQNLSTLVAAVNTYNGGTDAATASGADISGCQAGWFNISVDTTSLSHTLPDDIAPGGTISGNVILSMTDASTSQDACKNATPGITLYADQTAPAYYSVPANTTTSTATLAPGQKATISASGTWSCGSSACDGVGPGGAGSAPSIAPLPGAPVQSLIGSLNGGSSWFEIGSGPTTVTGPGTLVLEPNDWILPDNSGALTVTIQKLTSS